MNIISIDLPWKEHIKGRRTLAVADPEGHVKIRQACNDNELLELAHKNAEPGSIILLDIPIEGCDNLNGEHFRLIDKALVRQGLPVLPASRAGSRGISIKELIIKNSRKFRVYETYPYAIYKFLAYLKSKKLLECLKLDRLKVLLDDGFRGYWPPKYKRESDRIQRLRNIRYLYSLLTDSSLGLNFSNSLRFPDTSHTLSELNILCDEYDACLGAIAGIYFVNKSSYAWVAGDSNSGNILLLADQWLSERLSRQVKIDNLK